MEPHDFCARHDDLVRHTTFSTAQREVDASRDPAMTFGQILLDRLLLHDGGAAAQVIVQRPSLLALYLWMLSCRMSGFETAWCEVASSSLPSARTSSEASISSDSDSDSAYYSASEGSASSSSSPIFACIEATDASLSIDMGHAGPIESPPLGRGRPRLRRQPLCFIESPSPSPVDHGPLESVSASIIMITRSQSDMSCSPAHSVTGTIGTANSRTRPVRLRLASLRPSRSPLLCRSSSRAGAYRPSPPPHLFPRRISSARPFPGRCC